MKNNIYILWIESVRVELKNIQRVVSRKCFATNLICWWWIILIINFKSNYWFSFQFFILTFEINMFHLLLWSWNELFVVFLFFFFENCSNDVSNLKFLFCWNPKPIYFDSKTTNRFTVLVNLNMIFIWKTTMAIFLNRKLINQLNKHTMFNLNCV